MIDDTGGKVAVTTLGSGPAKSTVSVGETREHSTSIFQNGFHKWSHFVDFCIPFDISLIDRYEIYEG